MRKKRLSCISFIIVLNLFLWSGCKDKKGNHAGVGEVEKAPAPLSKGKEKDIKPFLKPEVINVLGAEDVKGEEAIVRDLIVSYNRVVVHAQINIEKLEGLNDLAAQRELTRMKASLEKDRTDGKIMSCTLNNLNFVEISLKGRRGIVKTNEDWFFEDRDLKTGGILEPLKDYEYQVEYILVKERDNWKVGKINITKVAGHFPARGEPVRVDVLTFKGGKGDEKSN